VKLFNEGVGRKFLGLIIVMLFLLIGLLMVEKMKIGGYEVYARWLVVAYGVFVGGNAGITISSLVKEKNKNGGKV